jgi:hypothetical protein
MHKKLILKTNTTLHKNVSKYGCTIYSNMEVSEIFEQKKYR